MSKFAFRGTFDKDSERHELLGHMMYENGISGEDVDKIALSDNKTTEQRDAMQKGHIKRMKLGHNPMWDEKPSKLDPYKK